MVRNGVEYDAIGHSDSSVGAAADIIQSKTDAAELSAARRKPVFTGLLVPLSTVNCCPELVSYADDCVLFRYVFLESLFCF